MTVRSSDMAPLSWNSDGNRIAENVRNILRIWQGEASFARPMGLDTAMPGRPAMAQLRKIASRAKDNIADFEPDANVLDVRAVLGAEGQIVIEVDVDE